MVRLRLLGGALVERSDGTPVAGRATQRHRVALLALLACAPGSRLSREKLIAFLWPESDRERGRNLLNVSVYELRRALGEAALRSAGDALRLDPAAVESDVASFEAAIARGDDAGAVAAYRGPLLDGFFVDDAPELERWVEHERGRLAGLCARALERLAEAAARAGDPQRAAEWWRRRAAHDPLDSRVAAALMRALDASGNRAGALQHAAAHERLLREELGAPLPAAVARLAAGLRAERGDGIAPEVTPEPAAASEPTAASEPAPAAAAGASGVPAADASPMPAAPAADGWAAPRRRPARRRAPAVVAAAAVVLLLLVAAWRQGVAGAGAETAARSLAVLPFVDMSADSANAYFGDGLSEQIITALSRVQGLHVAARTSSFALRGDRLDARVIGDTLGVEAVLEGSVRREGERLRVTAQLIDARTGYHLWSGEYDREVADVITVQDEIAGAIAEALRLRLPARAGMRGGAVADPVAYDAYLRALHLRSGLGEASLEQATTLVERAIELEPGFALAHAAKATIVAPRIYYRYVPYEEGVREMRAAVARALALDPELGEAHVALGVLRLFFEWDWEGAGQALRRAIALNPSDAHAWHHLANHHRALRRDAETIEARARALALDPLDARSLITLGLDYLAAGRRDEALAQLERGMRLDPMHPHVLGLGPRPPAVAMIQQARGRDAEAAQELLRVAALRRATADETDALRAAFARDGLRGAWRSWLAMDLRQSGDAANPMRLAILHTLAGDTGRALDELERAQAERSPSLIFLRDEATLEPLRAEPRFQRVVAAMRFPPP